jgi:hypothetical protein
MDKRKARMTRIRAVASKINDGIVSQAEAACKYPISVATLFCQHPAAEAATAGHHLAEAAAAAGRPEAAAKAVQHPQISAAV